MTDKMGVVLSTDEIGELVDGILETKERDPSADTSQSVESLRRVQQHQEPAALGLLQVIDDRCLPQEEALEILAEIAEAYAQDANLMGLVGECMEAVHDLDDLNRPAPEAEFHYNFVDNLSKLAAQHRGHPEEKDILFGLATACRMLGRQRDDVAEATYRRLVDLKPEKSEFHYNLGLFLKTRGRFQEGAAANLRAMELADEPTEATQWNLGICATGAGDAETALSIWKGLGNDIEMGQFGLPEGAYPYCKVKLAQYPLAQRDADNDDPGLEETIWIERLSPCHGIIRSVLYQDLGVDYGDVILTDGVPITLHTYGDYQVPVFPHLATLLHRNYQFYNFAGTQGESRQLTRLDEGLEMDAVIYSHTELFREVCANCWRDSSVDHARHEPVQKHVVVGQIAAPPEIHPDALLKQVDNVLAGQAACHLYSPELCSAAGFSDRAEVERRRYKMLINN